MTELLVDEIKKEDLEYVMRTFSWSGPPYFYYARFATLYLIFNLRFIDQWEKARQIREHLHEYRSQDILTIPLLLIFAEAVGWERWKDSVIGRKEKRTEEIKEQAPDTEKILAACSELLDSVQVFENMPDIPRTYREAVYATIGKWIKEQGIETKLRELEWFISDNEADWLYSCRVHVMSEIAHIEKLPLQKERKGVKLPSVQARMAYVGIRDLLKKIKKYGSAGEVTRLFDLCGIHITPEMSKKWVQKKREETG